MNFDSERKRRRMERDKKARKTRHYASFKQARERQRLLDRLMASMDEGSRQFHPKVMA